MESITAPPFHLTAELKELQIKMAALLAEQVAKGGVVGLGDTGPPPLTITTPADNEIVKTVVGAAAIFSTSGRQAAIMVPQPGFSSKETAADSNAAVTKGNVDNVASGSTSSKMK